MGNLTCTASGSVANFYTPYAVPIRSFKVHFSPKQSGSGDPSPENVRPIEGWKGVTGYRDKKSVVWNQWLYPLDADSWKEYDSNSVSISFADGIATSEWLAGKSGYSTSVVSSVVNSRNHLMQIGDIYYVSYMCKSSIGGVVMGVEYCGGRQETCVYPADANVWYHCSRVGAATRNNRAYTYIGYIRSSVPIGTIVQSKSPILINLTQMFGAGNEPETAEEFEAQCALNGINLDEYQAYDEGTVIGWKTADTDEIPVTFPAVGKNLYDEVSYPMTEWRWINGGDGTRSSNENHKCTDDFIPFEAYAGLTITLNKRPSGSNPGFAFYSDANNNSYISGERNNGAEAGTPWTITVPEGTKYMRFTVPIDATDIQIELGSISTEYEVYKGNTFYGGYVDLVSGDVVQEYDRYVFTGSENDLISYYDTHVAKGIERHLFQSRALDRIVARNCTNKCFSDKFAYYGNGTANTPIIFSIGTPVRQTGFFIDSTLCEPTVESFCEWLSNNNMEFVYLLETPITHTLSPQTLSTLVHSNAFWSNADSVEIEYDLAECGDIKEIRRRILLNAPHLEVASGSVAHFNTDMSAKLKECKVNFLPQQAGSGDPSPSNVRSISGWTGCDVVRSGKNIVQVLGYSAQSVVSKTGTRSLTNPYGTTISTTDFSQPDTPLVITQSQWPNEINYHYRNGYFYVVVDNLVFEKRYNVSFRVTNITNNPLNADISEIRLLSPRGDGFLCVAIGDRLCFNNVTFFQNTSAPNRSVFEIRTCGMSFTFSEFMVTPVEDEDYTYAPYDPDKITVSWDNLGTIYGGYIDVLRGELVQEWGIIASYNGETLPSEWISDRDVYSPLATPTTGAQVAYKLATPTTYSITQAIIKTLKGINNIFSDAGDVEVGFWTH